MTTTECVHNWKIKPANGPTSLGVCRLCHEKREFFNYVEDAKGFGVGRAHTLGVSNSKFGKTNYD